MDTNTLNIILFNSYKWYVFRHSSGMEIYKYYLDAFLDSLHTPLTIGPSLCHSDTQYTLKLKFINSLWIRYQHINY